MHPHQLARCLECLKTMESGKSPGTDGIPAEFYKVFWDDLFPFLLAALNSAFTQGHLSISQRRGLITLIPKKDKPLQHLKNWRPISLLNCDYKIATKAIAARIKKVLPDLINNDQTGFLKGRSIGENVRLIDSIITYAESQNIPGILLFIDFEKAFDTLEWNFIEKTLRYYNFGDSLITWVKLFYNDISSCIQNNGWSSAFFNLTRGVRQGCPLSPYLFILCVEILGNAIRNHDQIKGICVLGTECKLSQYADDTTLILDGSDNSVHQSFSLLDSFATISGLRINYEKTEALWIGSSRLQRRVIPGFQHIMWPANKVKALGVWFSTIKGESLTLNYEEKKEKVCRLVDIWQFRRLSLLGKITVIKSLLASQLVYILSPLPSSHHDLKEIKDVFFKFLWDGKQDKVKRTEIINDFAGGGLKMLDLQCFNRALKAKWIQRYLDPHNRGKWKLFVEFSLIGHDINLLLQGNLNSDDVASLGIEDPFTKELIETWSLLNFKKQLSNFGITPIWYNSLIRIDNKPIHYRNWSTAGIYFVNDLLEEDSQFLTFDTFKEKFAIKAHFLQYHGVICAISNIKRKNHCPQMKSAKTDTKSLLSSEAFCKLAYKSFLTQTACIPCKSQEKWLTECNFCDVDTIDWGKSYTLAFLCTKESKLRVFQFKLLHRKLATNYFLFKIGIKSNDQCSFCKESSETLLHLFWDCPFVKSFWNEISNWMKKSSCFLNEEFSFLSCIGLVNDTTNLLFHHALLIARYHIYFSKQKGFNPSWELFFRTILNCFDYERRYAIKTGTLRNFNAKWGAFTQENDF